MNDLVRKLKEEPTIITQVVQAALGLAVAFSLIGFTDVQTGAVLAVVAAVSGLLLALDVRPFQWSLVTGAVQAVILLIAEFGIEMTSEQIGAVYTAVALIGVVLRQFVTPEIKLPPESGAFGPVNEGEVS